MAESRIFTAQHRQKWRQREAIVDTHAQSMRSGSVTYCGTWRHMLDFPRILAVLVVLRRSGQPAPLFPICKQKGLPVGPARIAKHAQIRQHYSAAGSAQFIEKWGACLIQIQILQIIELLNCLADTLAKQLLMQSKDIDAFQLMRI